MFHHRSSKLKQENKSHKRGTASKRAIDNAAHGRVEKAAAGSAAGPRQKPEKAGAVASAGGAAAGGKHGAKHIPVAELSRANRVNHAKQLRDAKKAEANLMKRLGGGASGPARNIAIVPLSAHASALGVASLLVDFADGAALPSVPAGFPAPLTLSYKAFRQDVVVSAPPRGGQLMLSSPSAGADSPLRFDVTHTLAGVRGADVVVLVVNVSPAALSATAAIMEAATDSPSGKSVQVPLPLHPSGSGGSKRNSSARQHAGDDNSEGGDDDDDEDGRMSAKHSLAGRSTKTGLTAGTTVAEAAAAGLVDAEGELFLACLKATGVPSLIGVIQGLDAYSSPAKQAEARKSAQRLFETEFGVDVVKLLDASDPISYALTPAHPSSSSSSSSVVPTLPPVPVGFSSSPKTSGAAMHLCRALCSVAPKTVHWRAQRSYLSAQSLFWEPSTDAADVDLSTGEPLGTLCLYGYLRGRPLNVHQLVSLPWGGVYSLVEVAEARDAMRKPGHSAGNAVSTALTAEQASELVKSSSSSSSASVGGGSAAGAVGGHGYAFSEAGSAYIPLSEAILAVPTLASKIKVVAVSDLQLPSSSLALPSASNAGAGAGAGAGSAAESGDSDDRGVLAVANPHLAESAETLAPAEDDEDGEQNLDGFDDDEDEEEDEEGNEQEEEDNGDKKGKKKKAKKARPAGMSRYQASWLAGDDSNDSNEDEDEDEEEGLDEKPKSKPSSSSSAGAGANEDDDDDDGGDGDEEEGDEDVYAEGTLDPNDPEALRRIRKRKAAQRAKDAEGRAAAQRRRRRRKLKSGAGEGTLPQGYTPSDALEEASEGDGDEEGDEDDDDDDDEDGMAVDSKKKSSSSSSSSSSSAAASSASASVDPAVSWLMKRRAAAADELLFPDEKDTPVNQPARDRFQRYRGLSSFRSSPWDPKESLPVDYARVYGLPNFQKAQARILAEAALAEKALLSLESGAVAASKQTKKEEHALLKEKKLAERKAASTKKGGKGGSAGDEVEMLDGDGAESLDGNGGKMEMEGAIVAGSKAGSKKGPGSVGPGAGSAALTAAFGAGTQGLQEVLGDGWVATGSFVRLKVAKVPLSALRDASLSGGAGAPLTVFSLHRHEGKTSVLHFSLQRTDTYCEPIASKEQLEFHVGGHRVFDARPVFSAGGAGTISGSTRGKADRFFLGDRVVTATCYGPITYSPCPALVFKRIRLDDDVAKRGSLEVTARAIARSVGKNYGDSEDGETALAVAGAASASTPASSAKLYPSPDRLNVSEACSLKYRLVLVATGSIMGADPDRLIIKRTVLTGYPTRIKVRSATIKFMFFSPEDVEYWKPVEMYSKHGLAGTILEPLGTHGLMKCHFDKPMKQHDTVCMPLYKRVFPRWGDCYRKALGLSDEGEVEGKETKKAAGGSKKAGKKGKATSSKKSQKRQEMLDDDDDEEEDDEL